MAQERALLRSYQLGDLYLANRIVMAPITLSRANNNQRAPINLDVKYYSQRSGVGHIISEGYRYPNAA